jgi:prolyl-tRNA synthetase
LGAEGHGLRANAPTETSFGRRSVDWELKGVPVRVEIGPRDLAEGNVTVVTRHLRQKQTLALAAVRGEVQAIMARVAPDLLAEATRIRQERTVDVGTLEETVEAGGVGFARIPMRALGPDGEDRLATQALSIRCLQRADGSLAELGDDEADLTAVVARSY